MNIVIIKYNAGNIFSVDYALRRLGVKAEITGDHEAILSADKVIFPGVGEASTTMKYLRSHGLDDLICSLRQPVLGICIGMQLMCRRSEEGDTPCLHVFDEKVTRFHTEDGIKVPHMGWNSLQNLRSPLFDGLPTNPYVYFVHSYRVGVGAHTVATSDYPAPFSAALQRDNFYALQFHPEKSGAVGEIILRNFLTLSSN
ncbi:MAG: imidazole glycerol phosphate synthase subunit HisH [Bacteroidales bacterium]|jgi:glutamine amidotransferase|nr:imidazole glycerol phosphate synthase subunit HisH [Bacteroidales bacterium]